MGVLCLLVGRVGEVYNMMDVRQGSVGSVMMLCSPARGRSRPAPIKAEG